MLFLESLLADACGRDAVLVNSDGEFVKHGVELRRYHRSFVLSLREYDTILPFKRFELVGQRIDRFSPVRVQSQCHGL